ncbi:hypothetical protein HUZ36_17130 [Pseudoalteromonas sp. McH1-7]|uniref:hypothetical protein n=1 Tax=Pseudoalteromonas sp. McH1-7 TaxID=2745574 RepID=UPI001590514D|nr:hypothetical protein [Pseudoalteromonas sp. McH1-7]NUZ12511.1 hypothetical protein [Pseudoalteromonas sp. McH1-7]
MRNNCFLLVCSLILLTGLSACGGGSSGSNSDSVPPPVPPSSTVTLAVSSESIEVDSEFTLTWSTTYADSCAASGHWGGDKATSGSESITEVQIGTYTYTITCSGIGGEVSASVDVEITPLSNTEQWDLVHISFGTDDPNRQWLNIHFAYDQSMPMPIYLFAHGNGGSADGVSENELNAIANAGYAIVSWESIPTIKSPEEAAIGVADAQVVFDWVIANAETYNLDPNHIVVGGRSRGSIISWQLAHSNHPSIKGIYMYNALPQSAWQDTDTWSPVDEITIDSPITYLVYGPDFDDDDGHNPVNVEPVLTRYDELGIGDKITRYVDMWGDFRSSNGGWTNDAHTMHYFAEFVASLDIEVSPFPVNRTTSQISLEQQHTDTFLGGTYSFDFYRNDAYECGLSGNYTFMVANPANGDANTEAPLWVYLHGGGSGYFDENGDYYGQTGQTEDNWNHEETFNDLLVKQLQRRTIDDNDQPIDITLTRRIQEGYRVVLVSMCDHDTYSGLGIPYLNNPNTDAQVNGMQATMAAVDYTTRNYSTTHVFAHGTSAGGIGVYNLAVSYAAEGTHLTGIIADFYLGERALPLLDMFAGDSPYALGYDSENMSEKIGYFADVDQRVAAEDRINDGFDDVPILFVGGDEDPFCIGHRPAVAEAAALGLNNCEYVWDELKQAVDNQPNSPHQVSLLQGEVHIPTNYPSPAHDIVDNFIGNILASNPQHPFSESTNVIAGDKMMLMGHSFFRPFADQLPYHALQAGVDGHSQNVEFSGGDSGTPLSLWQDAEHRANVQAVLNSGDVDVFGMTCCDWQLTADGERELDSEGNPILSLEGWKTWFNYALAQNPETEFFIGIPWLDYPTDYADAETYTEIWEAFYQTLVLPAVDDLRVLYPGVTIYTIPYGDGVNELRKLFEAGNLPDVTNLQGPSDTSLFTDYKGHGGQLLKDFVEYIWIDAIYGVDLETYNYDDVYQTDLKALAKFVMDAQDPNYNGPNRR